MKRILFAFALVLFPGAACACFWDVDTLAAERSRFPTVLEIITGKFLRHSPEYYQWRVEDRTQKIQSDPTALENYDDLAVAYDKLGQQDKAIETILAKDRIEPGIYETEANLGTFLIHAGRYEEGLSHINRAIEINPSAHFGREKYQVLLVEYLLPRQKEGKPQLPLSHAGESKEADRQVTFADYLRDKHGGQLSPSATDEAIQGVLGIMRFSKHDSPVLLEALASLLAAQEDIKGEFDANLLAARAYVSASYSVQNDSAREAYRALAEGTLAQQFGAELADIEKQFKAELADAEDWYNRLREREKNWIAAGDDVDREFGKLYRFEPGSSQRSLLFRDIRVTVIVASMLLACLFAGIRRYWAYRRQARISIGSSLPTGS